MINYKDNVCVGDHGNVDCITDVDHCGIFSGEYIVSRSVHGLNFLTGATNHGHEESSGVSLTTTRHASILTLESACA